MDDGCGDFGDLGVTALHAGEVFLHHLLTAAAEVFGPGLQFPAPLMTFDKQGPAQMNNNNNIDNQLKASSGIESSPLSDEEQPARPNEKLPAANSERRDEDAAAQEADQSQVWRIPCQAGL